MHGNNWSYFDKYLKEPEFSCKKSDNDTDLLSLSKNCLVAKINNVGDNRAVYSKH